MPVVGKWATDDRYIVISTKGFIINPAAWHTSGHKVTSSYSIVDRHWCNKEVATFYAHPASRYKDRYAEAITACKRMNHDEHQWEHREGE